MTIDRLWNQLITTFSGVVRLRPKPSLLHSRLTSHTTSSLNRRSNDWAN